ncbi:ATP-binding cassette domain-containing protein [Cryptosporangium sp. NPDC048952]|uniref:ABC transporter permease subunit n=1 Tax=Cryptosporangium sp. NPDC048952 TaxID=3363961 RepID=UPI0037171E80
MNYVVFLILGLGSGAVFAALGSSLVVTFRSSGVVNFSTGAIALYTAYTFAYLRNGSLLIPIPGLPQSVSVGAPQTVASAMVISLLVAAVLGLLLYVLVFRPVRTASPVGKAVASIGVMLAAQSLLALRVGTNPVSVDPFLTQERWTVGDVEIPLDRVMLAGIVVLIALALGAFVKYTRFGLATRAVAETERGALVTGLSPDRIAAINWALSTVVAGVSGILIAPIVPLVPLSYTLFIVPALAAAMVGGFSRLGPTVAAGLAIGAIQSVLTYLQNTIDWFPSSGTAELVTLLIILALLIARHDRLPQRGSVAAPSLGQAPRPRNLYVPATVAALAGIVALLLTHGSVRAAIITTFIFAVLSLSQVVVTGFAGQVSLAQLSLAGAAAFTLSRLTDGLHIPFPIAPLLAALAATVLGVVVGLPALRLRGLPVAVVTLAMAVTVQALWFTNNDLNGGSGGARVTDPSLFGLDLGIGGGRGYPRISFGLLCLVVALLVGLGVAWLRRSRLGASMLAVRANERSAAAAGIDVRRVKVIAFAIGSFIAGLGGTLLAYQQNLASSESYGALLGIGLFANVYLAGVTSIGGGVNAGVIGAGGILYLLMDRYLGLGEYFGLFSGILLVVTVILNPEGIVAPLHALIARRRRTPSGPVDLDLSGSAKPGPPPEPGPDVLTVSDVGMRYGGVVALDGVTFAAHEGEILGLIGPNGAGKTTLIDALSGYARSTGSVALKGDTLDGLPPHRRSRAGLGRTFQAVELYEDLTVRENVLVGTNAAPAGADVDLSRMFEVLHLGGVADRTVKELSQGQRQLVSVARALAGRPAVLLLDEPAAGLDSAESRWLGDRLRGVRNSGVTVVMVDHDMGLVLDVCDRIVVLDLGRVLATGTPDEIRANPDVVRAYLGSSEPALASAPTEKVSPA